MRERKEGKEGGREEVGKRRVEGGEKKLLGKEGIGREKLEIHWLKHCLYIAV